MVFSHFASNIGTRSGKTLQLVLMSTHYLHVHACFGAIIRKNAHHSLTTCIQSRGLMDILFMDMLS